jgi:ectoine hydroxylase-related dioxygenase (phytanoyl-CoA dioxygenase family)
MIHSFSPFSAYNPAPVAGAATAELVYRYRRQGYVVIRGVVDQAMLTTCVEHLGYLQDRQPRPGPIVTAPLTSDPFLMELAGDPGLSNIAGCLLGCDPECFGCTYFVKPPRSGLPVLWHQDGHPWRARLGITEALTLWIALDRADESTGGLQVIPGSHHLDAQPLRPGRDQPNMFGSEIDPDLVDAALARLLALAPGDVSAHHPNLIHGSLPNWSEEPRRALAVRYSRAGGSKDKHAAVTSPVITP